MRLLIVANVDEELIVPAAPAGVLTTMLLPGRTMPETHDTPYQNNNIQTILITNASIFHDDKQFTDQLPVRQMVANYKLKAGNSTFKTIALRCSIL